MYHMPVSFWLVRVPPGSEEESKVLIEKIPSVEVTETGNGCLVIVTDTNSNERDKTIIEEIQSIKNIKDISYVLTASEEALSGKEGEKNEIIQ